MSEFPPDEPLNPDELFDSPEFQAALAYSDLDALLAKWMQFNPGVRAEDIDTALNRFRDAIDRRDKGLPPAVG